VLTLEGLEELHGRLETPLFNVVYRWVWDREEASDLVQETFLRLWSMRERVRMETVEPLAYRIGVNLASNRRRAARLRRMVGLGEGGDRRALGPAADDRLENAERQEAVRRAIAGLPERLRRVVLLCEFSEMSYREVGRALGIPEGTVGSRRHAALRRLRVALGEITEG
jgi:RNA polymerase sigma-70 factor (ECF subfamily)